MVGHPCTASQLHRNIRSLFLLERPKKKGDLRLFVTALARSLSPFTSLPFIMKQWLDGCRLGAAAKSTTTTTTSLPEAALAALGDRAFLMFLGSDDDRVVELLPPPNATTTTTTTTEDTSSPPPPPQTDAIQAVALQAEASTDQDTGMILWCAVSRSSKTLAVYRVELSLHNGGGGGAVIPRVVLPPTLVHTTKKRIGCLSFAEIPAKAAQAPTATTTTPTPTKPLRVVVAGDFMGDAWAYSTSSSTTTHNTAATSSSSGVRFLLGHTASMLTGLQMTTTTTANNHRWLLTSDRDEKIRVSGFPDTTLLRGFLLGSEGYVSSIAVDDTAAAADHHHRPWCVSCSGEDGTVRLWNYESLQPLAAWSVPAVKDDDETDTDSQKLTPARVAVHGEFVAVLHDQCPTIHILRIHDNGTSLQLFQTMECSDPAIGVTFLPSGTLLVSRKDPSYVQAYQRPDDASVFQHTPLPALQTLLQTATAAGIVLPDSTLEKDARGIPTLHKIVESRTTVAERPWNSVQRIATAQERTKRHRKRRKMAGKK